MVALGNISPACLPTNSTLEIHQLLFGEVFFCLFDRAFAFGFAPLILFCYFLLLFINRIAHNSLLLRLHDLSHWAFRQKQACSGFLPFSESPLVISFYEIKKFLHLQCEAPTGLDCTQTRP